MNRKECVVFINFIRKKVKNTLLFVLRLGSLVLRN